MHFDEKEERMIRVWTNFTDDSHVEDYDALPINDVGENNCLIGFEPEHGIKFDDFFDELMNKDIGTLEGHEENGKNTKFTFFKRKELFQDKNTPKSMMRIFLGHHLEISGEDLSSPRVIDINEAYEKLCKSIQEKIKLSFFKYVFSDSKFSKNNRKIFFTILSSPNIIRKEIIYNGNVRLKHHYLYAIKVMKIRCSMGTLCERAQTR